VPRLAFLTLDQREGYVIDDALAAEVLGRRGWTVTEVPWRRLGDPRAWDAVVIRTPWDYHHHIDEFLACVDAIEAAGVPLGNSAGVVRWNAVKTYLRELEGRGVPIVPTVWGQGLDPGGVAALAERLGVEEGVLKPVVGANAGDTFRVRRGVDPAEAGAIAERYPAGRGWMAQPFVRSVLDAGEVSLFAFGGRWSHAVRKVPKAGDFRVQEDHGGTILPLAPDAELLAAGERVLAALGPPPLQARVDLVRLDDGQWALMELELIEPALYFRVVPGSAEAFADAVERWLQVG